MSLSSSSFDFGDLKCSNSRINARFVGFDYPGMNSSVVDDHHVILAVQLAQDGPLTFWPELSGSPVQREILHPNHSRAIESPFRNLAFIRFTRVSSLHYGTARLNSATYASFSATQLWTIVYGATLTKVLVRETPAEITASKPSP